MELLNSYPPLWNTFRSTNECTIIYSMKMLRKKPISASRSQFINSLKHVLIFNHMLQSYSAKCLNVCLLSLWNLWDLRMCLRALQNWTLISTTLLMEKCFRNICEVIAVWFLFQGFQVFLRKQQLFEISSESNNQSLTYYNSIIWTTVSVRTFSSRII